MTDTITLTGLVATTPRHLVTGTGLPITTFRLASTQRRYDRGQQKWVDGDTNWFTITSFRQLATNVVGSVQKGQRVVVTGRLRIRDWESDDKKGTNVEVDADALGHDLSWGSSVFTRSAAAAVADAEGDAFVTAAAGDLGGTSDPEAGAAASSDSGDDEDTFAPSALAGATPF